MEDYDFTEADFKDDLVLTNDINNSQDIKAKIRIADHFETEEIKLFTSIVF